MKKWMILPVFVVAFAWGFSRALEPTRAMADDPDCDYPRCISPEYACIDWFCCQEEPIHCNSGSALKTKWHIYYDGPGCTNEGWYSWACATSCGPPQ